MFFGGNIFWLLMGVILVVIGAGAKAFAEDLGWHLTWWKGVLAVVWYGMFIINFYVYGTLEGEYEGSAGFKMMLVGLLVTLILGVGLWRLMMLGGSDTAEVEG